MSVFQGDSRIIITCSHRLSLYLETEVRNLGYSPVRVFKTGVELKGDMSDCIRLNLHLYTAGQVLFSLRKFRAIDADDLYRELVKMEWEKILSVDGFFP